MASQETPVLEFQDVSLRYQTGPEVLKNLNYCFDPGSFHFVVGPSGAGKSSFLQLVYMGLIPSRGAVKLFGQDTAQLTTEQIPLFRRRMGIIFQDFRLLNHLTVFENVALPLKLSNQLTRTTMENVAELLSWVGLEHYMKAYPPTLSGGQKQRVAIARAVVARPWLILADEPTGNVDYALALKLMHLFTELHREGTTIIITTHNMHLVQEFPYPTLGLENGTLKTKRA